MQCMICKKTCTKCVVFTTFHSRRFGDFSLFLETISRGMCLSQWCVSLCCWLQLDISFATNMCFEINLHASFCGVRNWYVKVYECKCGCRRWSARGGIDLGQPKFTLWSSYPCSKFHCAGMPHKGSQLMFVMLSCNLSNATFYTKCRCSSPINWCTRHTTYRIFL